MMNIAKVITNIKVSIGSGDALICAEATAAYDQDIKLGDVFELERRNYEVVNITKLTSNIGQCDQHLILVENKNER
jgi:hypothetical protein